MTDPSGRSCPRPARLALVLVAAVLGAGLLALAPAGAARVAAASSTLSLVTATRYDVQPDQHKVHVTVDATARATAVNDPIHAYYFTGISAFPVQPKTSGYAATVGGKAVAVSATKRTADYVLLAIQFGQNLNAGSSLAFRLQFDLVDPGGSPDRTLRISSSLVSFQAWAFAITDTPGSSVTVVFPAGYTAKQEAGALPAPTTDASGITTFSSGPIAHPLGFYADMVADRPGAYDETILTVGQLAVTVRAWSDDPAWGKQVADLLGRGLPALTDLIGLGTPGFESLAVQESVSRSLGGYSGLFDPATGQIQVAYFAPPFVILHEAAHAWFNSRLATDRWIDEAFASYYAELAARALDLKVSPQRLTPELEKARVALNDWGALGRADRAVEDYAYAATLQLAELVGTRATPEGLAKVWTAVSDGLAAYQPVHAKTAEKTDQGPPDWRGLLDQLEERTGASFVDLWRTWVVSGDQAGLLDARAAARADYRSTLEAAGAWELPRPIRDALGAWQFPDATRLMVDARAVLAQRDAIARRAAAGDLIPPATLRTVFEQATGSLASAAGEARDEAATLGAIEAATAASKPDHGLLGQVGLAGASPAADLTTARSSFEAGDLATARARAATARSAWDGAEATGRGRVLAAAAILLLLLVGALLLRLRRRRSRTIASERTVHSGPA